MDFEIHKDEVVCNGIKENLNKNKCDRCSQYAEFLMVVNLDGGNRKGPSFVFEI